MPESTPPDHAEVKSGPISVGPWKRCNDGPARSEVFAFGTNPADGGRPDPRRAPARRLRGNPAELLQPVLVEPAGARPCRSGAAANGGGNRPGQGRAAAAAVGLRQCRGGGAVDEKRRRNGASRV